MNLSLNWLREYVPVDLAPDALADLLTMAGLEVDGVEATGPSLDGVVKMVRFLQQDYREHEGSYDFMTGRRFVELAAHLTRLSDFGPVSEGRVIVSLDGGASPAEQFEIEGVSVPGIFRPVNSSTMITLPPSTTYWLSRLKSVWALSAVCTWWRISMLSTS